MNIEIFYQASNEYLSILFCISSAERERLINTEMFLFIIFFFRDHDTSGVREETGKPLTSEMTLSQFFLSDIDLLNAVKRKCKFVPEDSNYTSHRENDRLSVSDVFATMCVCSA